MITTITLNPSVDRSYMIDDFEAGQIFRTSSYGATAGGKGLNVTRVASALGEKVLATGLLGGKSGEFIEAELDKVEGVSHDFVKIEGETRSCIAIVSAGGGQTEILESGPTVSERDLERFLTHYKSLVEKSSIIVASGSILAGMPKTIYTDLIKMAKEQNVPFLLDTSGIALQEGIKAGPTLVKPNLEELEAYVGRKLVNEADVVRAGKQLAENGIVYVVISLGGEGSIVIHHNNVYRVRLPKVEVINPVGSGDSMVAGFAVGLARNYDLIQTIKLASASGTANAVEQSTGSINLEKVQELMAQIVVE
ncbi:fructose-1-phosphate kinase [Bacillus oleivorans]|uniref:1-phosphofructokinase n=1 Tax=Bacillus oleivorans TaxID=1448271 RepID=A0A285CR11_9BACI|nr:1-phosphofructokinase [Bacillus oleivorans]SNX69506.1 fructose-1-phosphate kinase [Bacillus oleivorans]